MTAVAGPDGVRRCPWALSAPEYIEYHDNEWGRAVHGDDAMFERLVLEAFQSGLSFITILRKRRTSAPLSPASQSRRSLSSTEADAERLMSDVGIVRNRAKIAASMANARAAMAVPEGLSAAGLVVRADPSPRRSEGARRGASHLA